MLTVPGDVAAPGVGLHHPQLADEAARYTDQDDDGTGAGRHLKRDPATVEDGDAGDHDGGRLPAARMEAAGAKTGDHVVVPPVTGGGPPVEPNAAAGTPGKARQSRPHFLAPSRVGLGTPGRNPGGLHGGSPSSTTLRLPEPQGLGGWTGRVVGVGGAPYRGVHECEAVQPASLTSARGNAEINGMKGTRAPLNSEW